MSNIHIKMMSEDAVAYLKREGNLAIITDKIKNNPTNEWVFKEFPSQPFVEKTYEIEDFELKENPDSQDKHIDFENSVAIYEHLKNLPRYVLCDERFWLWLEFDKFYPVVRTMMKINGVSTIKNMWMFTQGIRRGLTFGVLSRLFVRVDLSIDESHSEDVYWLTRWVVNNPERFRNLTWRSYSSEAHLVRGALKGEKKALEDSGLEENNDIYPIIGKYVSQIGSVRLLDIISEEDMERMVYNKTLELLQTQGLKDETVC